MERLVYTTTASRGEQAETLVLHCSSYEIAAPVREFLQNHLKLGDHDTLALPGGIQLLARSELFPRYHGLVYRWIEFLSTKHALKRAVVIIHEGCSWYRELTYGGFPNDPEQARRQQHDDLRRTAQMLNTRLGLSTESYVARPQKNGLAFFSLDS